MKKKLFWILIVIIVMVFQSFPETPHEVNAARGCCMQRSGSGWYPNGMNFNQCREANRNYDRNDNLYQPIGSIWWNVNC